jgi:hypothetical protein
MCKKMNINNTDSTMLILSYVRSTVCGNVSKITWIYYKYCKILLHAKLDNLVVKMSLQAHMNFLFSL